MACSTMQKRLEDRPDHLESSKLSAMVLHVHDESSPQLMLELLEMLSSACAAPSTGLVIVLVVTEERVLIHVE